MDLRRTIERGPDVQGREGTKTHNGARPLTGGAKLGRSNRLLRTGSLTCLLVTGNDTVVVWTETGCTATCTTSLSVEAPNGQTDKAAHTA